MDAPPKPRPRGAYVALATAIAVLTVGVAGVAFGRWERATPSQPTFQPVTFRRGTLLSARFAPTGDTIVYGAAWDGKQPETFAVTGTSPESRPLGFANTDIYGISSKGELALSYRTTDPFPPTAGVLAEVPLLGGAAPREIQKGIEFADWAPDGSMAVTIDAGIGDRLEYPIGNTLYETNGPIHMIRVSHDGTLVAFFEPQDKGGAIATIDKAKKKTTLTTGWRAIDGLAWSPSGDEVWFSGKARDTGWGLYAVTRAGALRTILRTPGEFYLHDVGRDGRVLASEEKPTTGVRYMAPGADHEEDLSWLDASLLRDLSADGRTLLFDEVGEAAGADGSVIYLRSGNGSPAVRLGSGVGWALSPDDKSVLTSARGGRALSVMPTGPGATQRLKGDVRISRQAAWLADGRRVVFGGDDEQGKMRLYLQDVAGDPRPISPSGEVDAFAISPDETTIAAALDRRPVLLKLTGGAPQPLPWGKYYEYPLAWSRDGRSLFMDDTVVGATISRVDVATGTRTAWKTLLPSDSAGVTRVSFVVMRDEGRSYAYSYVRRLSQLFVISGLK